MVWGHVYEYGFMYLRRVYTRGVNHCMRPGQSGGMHACMCLSRVNHVRICMRRCTWLHESDQLCVYMCVLMQAYVSTRMHTCTNNHIHPLLPRPQHARHLLPAPCVPASLP